MSERLRLGDMLVAARLVTEAQVQEALARQKKTSERLGEALVALGYVSEPQMTQVLSNQLSIPWVNLYHIDFSRELLERVPADLAEEYRLIPVYVRHVRRQGDTLYVALDDPLNLDALQKVADATGLPVKPMVASPSDIENAIRVYYLGLPPLEEKPAAAAPQAAPPAKPAPEAKAAPEAEAAPVKAAPEAKAAAPKPKLAAPETAPELREAPADPAPAPAAPSQAAEPRAPETPPKSGPTATPSQPPPPRLGGARFLTLTLLDGTQVRLPSPSDKKKEAAPADERAPERGLTTRDLIHALAARAAGEDVGGVLPDDAWEPLFATLLSVLMRKGLIADWEFVDEWKKHRKG